MKTLILIHWRHLAHFQAQVFLLTLMQGHASCIMHDVKVSTHVETNNNNSTLGSTPDSDILLSNKTPVYKKYFYTLKQHVETNNMLKQTTCWTTCLIVTFCYQTKLQFIRNIFIHWNNMLKQTTCWNKQHVETNNNNNSTLGSTPDSDILLSNKTPVYKKYFFLFAE